MTHSVSSDLSLFKGAMQQGSDGQKLAQREGKQLNVANRFEKRTRKKCLQRVQWNAVHLHSRCSRGSGKEV